MPEHMTVGKLIEFLKVVPEDYELVDDTARTLLGVEITDVWSPWDEGTDREHYTAVKLIF